MLEAVPAGLIKISSARSVDSWIRSSIQGGRCFPQKPCFKSYSADAIMSAWKAKDKNLLRKLYDECDDFLRVYDAVSLYSSRRLILTHLFPGLGLSYPYKVKLSVRKLMENN